uniref:Uncharacterized protein n=1 Tax=Ixodes ricinus TaxID=34613 RepID=A0A6B0UMT7_IXORI
MMFWKRCLRAWFSSDAISSSWVCLRSCSCAISRSSSVSRSSSAVLSCSGSSASSSSVSPFFENTSPMALLPLKSGSSMYSSTRELVAAAVAAALLPLLLPPPTLEAAILALPEGPSIPR